VAKILVADDNSNIQKMVGLALKDQGIDVVAVGNGEAAVRKISDVRPDLVLADVFMPVRNGYEVCKYVKGDSALSHIPVILLVGAFDPLDEEEAQRVGADGVLKKPFVPPDPLISMVKSALVRSSAGTLNTLKPAANNKGGNATVISSPANPSATAPPSQGVPEAEPAVENVPARPTELKIEPGTQAFGNLLETSPAQAEESSYVAHSTPALERDWSSGQEEEDEEEEEDSSSWRRDGGSEDFANEAEAAKQKTAKPKREAWTPTREKTQDLLEAAQEPEFVSEVPKPAKASSPAPVPPVAPVIPPPPAAVIAEAGKSEAPAKKPADSFVSSPADTAVPPAPADPAPAVAVPDGKSDKGGASGSWFSISSTPWEANAQPAAHPAPSWDAPASPAASQPAEASFPPVPEPTYVVEAPGIATNAPELEPEAAATGFYTNSSALPELVSGGQDISPATVETLRQEATQVVEESTLQRLEESAPQAAAKAPEGAAPDVEDLVAKVLAKMNPDVLQAVTREILKPVVEAMVREEMKSKK
jgi:CheY-like chemotaxis protein